MSLSQPPKPQFLPFAKIGGQNFQLGQQPQINPTQQTIDERTPPSQMKIPAPGTNGPPSEDFFGFYKKDGDFIKPINMDPQHLKNSIRTPRLDPNNRYENEQTREGVWNKIQ